MEPELTMSDVGPLEATGWLLTTGSFAPPCWVITLAWGGALYGGSPAAD
jgi:hypothetical protein